MADENQQDDGFDWKDFFSGAMGLFGLLGGGAALGSGYNRLGGIGEAAQRGAMQIAQQGLLQSQFKPFGVTTTTGSAYSYDPETGGVRMGLSPAERALQNRMMGQAMFYSQPVAGASGLTTAGQQALARGQSLLGEGAFGRELATDASRRSYTLGQQFMEAAGLDTGQRESDIYGRIRDVQRPEEERNRIALEERLAAQGRLGVSTNLYGGTPEQLAVEKARAEAMNSAMLSAMGQARQEQAQQAALGAQFTGLGAQQAMQRQNLAQAGQQQALQLMAGGQGLLAGGQQLRQMQQQLAQGALAGSYVPQAQLLNAQQASQIFPQLQQRGQLYGAGLYGEGAMGGLSALLSAELGQANLLGQLGTNILGGLAGDSGDFGSIFGEDGVYDVLFGDDGLFGGLFPGSDD